MGTDGYRVTCERRDKGHDKGRKDSLSPSREKTEVESEKTSWRKRCLS